MGNPDALLLKEVQEKASEIGEYGLHNWLKERKSRRIVPHRMESCGYARVRNPNPDDGMWKIDGRRQVVYARRDLTQQERLTAASELATPKRSGR